MRPLSMKLQRISLLIFLITGGAASAAQIFFHPVVALFAPKFIPGVAAFEVLVLNLVCTTAPLLVYSVLLSAVMDRQNVCAAIQLAGLVLNVALGWWFIQLGWGLPGIAWSSALSQLAVAAAAYWVLHPYLFESASAAEALHFYAWAVALPALAVGIHFAMHWGPFTFVEARGMLAVGASRILLAGAAWSRAAWLMRRVWWNSRSRVPI